MSKSFEDLIRNYKPKRFSRLKRKVKDIISFPSHKYYEAKYFVQRGKRGWSIPDVWDLDGYLARVMGQSIAHLAETTHGWPGEGSDWPKFEDWQNELREVSKKLIAYDSERWTAMTVAEEMKVYNEFVEALNRISKYWGHLWD